MAIVAQVKVGEAGYVIIDDDGSTVRFQLRQDYSATFIGSPGKDWWGTINGVNVGGKWTWASGGGTRTIAAYGVSSSQTVSFSIGATGTSGFGGGGGTSAWIARATVPAAPTPLGVDEITTTSQRYRFSGNSNGGAAIIEWEAQRATDAAFTQNVVSDFHPTSGTRTFTGLTPATRYYYRSRGRNSVGWGGWSGTLSAETLPATPPGITVEPNLAGTAASAILTPPSGASGVTKYTVERRAFGTTAPVTTTEGPTSPIPITGLTPGSSYDYRASAWFGTYQSPWSDWITVVQPNPNTDPGAYFDGNTPDTPALDYAWTGAAGNSTSIATGQIPSGWRTFAQAAAGSGGTGVVFRASGGFAGSFAARAVFFTDSTAYGFAFGTGHTAASMMADVEGNALYHGSVYAWPSRSQRLRAAIRWYDSSLAFISGTAGSQVVVAAGGFTRLSASGTAPGNAAYAIIIVENVSGTGGSLWLGGDWLHLDAAMVSLQELFPYFDGDTADTQEYAYSWLGAPNASPSIRSVVTASSFDPLADPDCPPIPGAPQPPVVEQSCIVETGTWRRYWVSIPESEVYDWLAVVPTMEIMTGGFDARQVRVRFYPNPDNLAPDAALGLTAESEQVISYMPADTVLTLDGVSESAWASVSGGDQVPAGHLLYGANGGPATWPVLSCGDSYLISLDVPLDAPEGNISVGVSLTTRMT